MARDGARRAPDRVATWQREIAQPLPSVRPISGRAVDFKLLAFAVTVVVEQLPSGSMSLRFPGFPDRIPVSHCTQYAHQQIGRKLIRLYKVL